MVNIHNKPLLHDHTNIATPDANTIQHHTKTTTPPYVGKVYTRAQAEPGPTRLLLNHLGLPQTNELGQCTLAGRHSSSTHQEDCCLPHGPHTPNDRRQTSTVFHHQPAASRLKSRKSFMRTVTPLDSSASSSRLQLWKYSLKDVPSSVKMGLEVAESLPAGSGEDWLCWRAINRLRTGVGRAKTMIRRWSYLGDAQSVDCDSGEPQTMAHLLSCRLLTTWPQWQRGQMHAPANGRTSCEGHERRRRNHHKSTTSPPPPPHHKHINSTPPDYTQTSLHHRKTQYNTNVNAPTNTTAPPHKQQPTKIQPSVHCTPTHKLKKSSIER